MNLHDGRVLCAVGESGSIEFCVSGLSHLGRWRGGVIRLSPSWKEYLSPKSKWREGVRENGERERIERREEERKGEDRGKGTRKEKEDVVKNNCRDLTIYIHVYICNILLNGHFLHLSRTDLTTFIFRMRTPTTTTTIATTVTADTAMAIPVLELVESSEVGAGR